MTDWRIYPKAFRDPTMADVKEQAEEVGKRFWKDSFAYGGRLRRYYVQGLFDAEPTLLQEVRQGERPDWRSMLKQLGSNWA